MSRKAIFVVTLIGAGVYLGAKALLGLGFSLDFLGGFIVGSISALYGHWRAEREFSR